MKKHFVLLAVALLVSLFLASSNVLVVSQSATRWAGVNRTDGTSVRWIGDDRALVNHSATAQAALTATEKQEILAAHNNARKTVLGNTGGPLPAMTWDDNLAAVAQKWANTLAGRCNGSQDHSPNTQYGENLFSGWSSDPTAPPITAPKAISYWVGEKRYYTYSKTRCPAGSVCGTCSKLPCVHYTQIVWRTSTKVGCARARCKSSGKYWTIWVCNYDPAGNIAGQPPY
jgi:pathogenesis-related protein 1